MVELHKLNVRDRVNFEKKIFNCPMLTATSVGNSWVMIIDFKFVSEFWLKYQSALPLSAYTETNFFRLLYNFLF